MTANDLLGLALIAGRAFTPAFGSLFSIINPIGGAFIFDSVMTGNPQALRATVAARIGFYSLLIMFGSLWVGAVVLAFFGVSLDALRIAGGLVVAATGWRLMSAGDQRAERRSGATASAADRSDDPLQKAFFPLTLPLTTGPGTIAVAITLGAERPPYGYGLLAFFIGVSLAAVANAGLIWIAYRSANRVADIIGASARHVVVRLSAFLLMCVGVQILVTAAGDLAMTWSAARPV
jgi:multiple antibiotic resistance protein